MVQLVRVQNFCVWADGFGAGEHQSLESPCTSRLRPSPSAAANDCGRRLMNYSIASISTRCPVRAA